MKNFTLSLIALLAIFSCSVFSEENWNPELVQRGIATLQHSAAGKTEFTFDHSMLVLASKLDHNDDLQRVIAGISGVSVRRYSFAITPWPFEQTALTSMNDEYRAAGWKKLMSKNHETNSSMTDIWARMDNNAISNVAILVSRSNEVNFVSISGSISPADISHLTGHFGIPRIEGGVEVPAPDRKP
jgi:Domain of unknown function (DUF4252)